MDKEGWGALETGGSDTHFYYLTVTVSLVYMGIYRHVIVTFCILSKY